MRHSFKAKQSSLHAFISASTLCRQQNPKLAAKRPEAQRFRPFLYMELLARIELATPSLPWKCSTIEPQKHIIRNGLHSIINVFVLSISPNHFCRSLIAENNFSFLPIIGLIHVQHTKIRAGSGFPYACPMKFIYFRLHPNNCCF